MSVLCSEDEVSGLGERIRVYITSRTIFTSILMGRGGSVRTILITMKIVANLNLFSLHFFFVDFTLWYFEITFCVEIVFTKCIMNYRIWIKQN